MQRQGLWCAPVPLLLVLLSTSCSAPATFSQGQPFALGPFTLTVSHAEVLSRDQRSQDLVVHYRCDQISSLEAARQFRILFAGHITITDSEGNEYETRLPTTAGTYRSYRSAFGVKGNQAEAALDSGGFTPNQWVAVARVPAASRGFTLVITNPDYRDGQPTVLSIKLGR